MDSIADTDVYPGQTLAGKFRIERVLGRGGMGVVVSATHIQLDEKVALKFLLPEALKNQEAVRRFEREARAAVKIKSEHVARVTDVGTLETGAPYMVMEYLNGMDLGDYLEETGPLPYEEAIGYLLQASEAIAEAHSIGIVHRDLKPANLFRIIRSDGTPSIKVLDFGISKVTTGSEASMTQTSSMMGSPYYMSPEQMTSAKNVDHRADVWALGIILHELLTGKVPYEGETIPEICVQVLQNPPPRLTELREGAPIELEIAVERALAKNREERFGDVAEFAAALAPFSGVQTQHSVERISKVLGVMTAPQVSPAGLKRTADLGQAGPSGRLAGKSSGAEADGLSATTLGGAAHEQPDYQPPTKSGKAPLLIAALILLAGGGAFFAMKGNPGATEQEPVVAAEPEEEAEAEKSAAQPEPEPEEPAAEESEAKEAEAAPEAAKEEATPAPVAAPAPRPAPRPAPKVQVAPAPQPAPAPAPRPAPKPAPKPKKSTSSLYLDRK